MPGADRAPAADLRPDLGDFAVDLDLALHLDSGGAGRHEGKGQNTHA
jgi:hypothetical protein